MVGLSFCPRGCKTNFAVYNKERIRMRNMISLNRPPERVAYVMGMTPKVVVKRGNTSRPETAAVPPAPPVIDNFTVGTIRRFVHSMFAAKQYFTVGKLTENLKRAGIVSEFTSETSVWRLLHNMGFRYKTSQRKVYVRKESLDIVCRRINALWALQRHRGEGREVVYLDETWFTTRMNHSREWVDTTQAVTSDNYSRQIPPGKGERFVVVAAGTASGFVEGSFLCYAAKNTSGDYHGEMMADLFLRWLTTQLLPLLTESSVLVLDNAPYHSKLTAESRCLTTATKKSDLINWLEKRRLPVPPGATRPKLLLICHQNRPKPQYTVGPRGRPSATCPPRAQCHRAGVEVNEAPRAFFAATLHQGGPADQSG
ncbi:uncharacterized protein LOC127009526 [Eriocheir sinensis]|uniref:uncharacterized protein LOC127009526 n=1 Tax=Eriocheir sinensis TaxID=95602 RepID=UPI0021C73A7F|nr:uncharacterized protein LOC127009526 [Eriocheir sinensis]